MYVCASSVGDEDACGAEMVLEELVVFEGGIFINYIPHIFCDN